MSYEEIWRRSLSRPDEFWSEAAEKLVWQKRWERTLDDSNPPHYRWFAGGEINTCHNAIDRHVEDGFGDLAGADLRQPHERPKARLHIRRSARANGGDRRRAVAGGSQKRRGGDYLYADDSGSRFCDARLRANRRAAFGRFRRLWGARVGGAHRRLSGGFCLVGFLRLGAGAGSRLQKTARRRAGVGATQSQRLRDFAAPSGIESNCAPGAISIGRSLSTARRRPNARAWRRPILCIFFTLPARPARPKESCVTTAAMRSRCFGRWRAFTMFARARFLGRFGYRLGGGAFVYRVCAVFAARDHGVIRRQAGRHAGRGRVLARHRRASGGGDVHGADGVAGD